MWVLSAWVLRLLKPWPRLRPAAATPSVAPTNILLNLDRKFAAAELLKPGATYSST